MTTVLNGLLGGLVVGLVAGFVTLVTSSNPSIAARLVTGRDGDDLASRVQELGVYTLYGAVVGGSLLVAELYALQGLGVPPTVSEAFGVALGWATLLFAVWVAVLRWGRQSNRALLGDLFVYHLVFGLGFGIWIRVTWIT